MNKVDFKRELKHLYQPSGKAFALVDVPAMQFLMIDGHGDPNKAQAYTDAVAALYAVAYKLKFASKQQLGQDYTVLPLEGLWWADNPNSFTTHRDKSEWDWTMMIMQPDWITAEMMAEATAVVEKQKELPALPLLRLESYHEGLCAQIMHTGSYEAEAPVLRRLHHEFMPAHGLTFNGKHHEIYLSDPRRVAPEKLKTVLRQPVTQMP
ncbi:MAG: GyrI-like domain-containing protein [Ardenticatenaceae bacterium]|nr:GyrI-like domain-containing protein [Ardenticatenaceae bacterium]